MEPTKQAEKFDLRGPREVLLLKATHPLKLKFNVYHVTLNALTNFYI